MSGSIGAVQGGWFAVGGQQASRPEFDSSADTAFYLRWPFVSVLELGPYAAAPSCARLHTKNVLVEWQLPRGYIEDAEMICSELITNALRATCALDVPLPIGLRLLANRQRLVIEAWDCHPNDPIRRPVSGDAEGGRGLQIVEGLCNRWGSRRLSAHVKAVWAELLLPGR